MVNTPTEELLETAVWLDERAAELEKIAAESRKSQRDHMLRVEVARIRGRAALIRFEQTGSTTPLAR